MIAGDEFIFSWSNKKLTAFNARGGDKIYSIEGDIYKVVYGGGNLYILNGENLEVYSAAYGTIKWSREAVSSFTTNFTRLITDEEDSLAVLDMTGTLEKSINGNLPENNIIWFNNTAHYLNDMELWALTDEGWSSVYSANDGNILQFTAEDENLYLGGETSIIKLDEEYNLITECPVTERIKTMGVTDEKLFVLNETTLTTYNKSNLQEIFTVFINGDRMALTLEKIFLTGSTGTYALNGYTGSVIWQVN